MYNREFPVGNALFFFAGGMMSLLCLSLCDSFIVQHFFKLCQISTTGFSALLCACVSGCAVTGDAAKVGVVLGLHIAVPGLHGLGKGGHARELGIQFSLRRDSTMPLHSAYLSSRELVTIVGNLVENAFEAVRAEPLKQVGLFIGEDAHGLTITVDDTGHGMTEQQIAADTGLSKVTVRRYLNYLIGTNEAENQVDYSTGGRPRVEYRSR